MYGELYNMYLVYYITYNEKTSHIESCLFYGLYHSEAAAIERVEQLNEGGPYNDYKYSFINIKD